MRLTGKVAVITGAGSGIGRGAVRRFVAEGATVAAVDIDEATARESVRLAVAGDERSARTFACDVSREDQVASLFAAVEDAFGGVDVVYSNAGIPMTVPLADLTVAQWDAVMAVNARGTLLVAKLGAPYLAKRHGAIVTTGSTVGIVPTTNRAAYVASKGAIIMLTKALALELAPLGIRVNCVCPGPIDTPAMRTFLTNEFGTAEPVAVHLARYGKIMPLRRLGTPDDVAAAAVFLASDDASWITGAILPVDGGKTITGIEFFANDADR